MRDPEVIRKSNGELAVLSKNEAVKLLLLKGMSITEERPMYTGRFIESLFDVVERVK